MPGIDDFKSRLKGGGARPNLFRTQILFPSGTGGDTELTSFMVKAAQLPASVVGLVEVPFRGRKLKVAGDRTFEPWTITVINDTGMEVRRAFESWMNLVNAHSSNTSAFVGQRSLDYMTNMFVEQLDRDESVVRSYTIHGAYPTNIQAIDLNFETVDTIEEFTVEFNYQYWTSGTEAF
jgi:hypothetical protein